MKASASAGQGRNTCHITPASFQDFPGPLEWLGVTILAIISACTRMIKRKLGERLLISIAALQVAAV